MCVRACACVSVRVHACVCVRACACVCARVCSVTSKYGVSRFSFGKI